MQLDATPVFQLTVDAGELQLIGRALSGKISSIEDAEAAQKLHVDIMEQRAEHMRAISVACDHALDSVKPAKRKRG